MASSLARGRRDAAARDIGRTVVGRPVSMLLIAAFCVTMLAAGVVQHLVALWASSDNADGGWSQPYDVFQLLPTGREIAEARRTRDLGRLLPSLREITEYEDALEEESVLDGAILPRAQYALARYLGLGNEQVYIGRDGELFYRADVDYVTGRGFLDPVQLSLRAASGASWEDPPAPDPRPALRSLHEALTARDIALVLLPVPVKPAVQNHGLVRAGRPAVAHSPSYDGFIASLVADGVHVVDATDSLLALDAPYLKTDTHWTPAAMELVAKETVDYLRDSVGLDPLPPVGHSRASTEVVSVGDVSGMLALLDSARLVKPERIEISPVTTADGEPWTPQRDARVLLLGDSFSNIYSLGAMGWGEGAGLAEQLSYALQEPVDRIALNDGGAHAARRSLSQELARGDDRLGNTRVVVYQFAVRELYSGDWRVYEMPTPVESGRNAADRGAAAPGVLVKAVVIARSSPPAPGSVPYPDCVIALHLTSVLPEGTGVAPDEAVAFVWGMRDSEWTRAASIDPGAAVRLRLTPWIDAEREFGSYSRRELEDEDTWFLDTYWGEIIR